MLAIKLNQIIAKYSHNKEISAISQNKEMFAAININFKFETDDFDQSDIIIIDQDIDITNYKFINEYINKNKTIVLIVKLKYKFSDLVKNTDANSIDAINWKNADGTKYEDYIIVMNKY